MFTVQCGTPPSTASTAPVIYGFAGVNQTANAGTVTAIRASISWTVPPKMVDGHPVSTWIAFANASAGTGVSYRIAQVGWIQTQSEQPRVFWEWGSSKADSHKQYGAQLVLGRALEVEVDLTGATYSFYANGVALGSGLTSWSPTAVGAFAETQDPSEYLPGSSGQPEVISAIAEKINGKWMPYSGEVLTTRPVYHVTAFDDGSVHIWDGRQSE